MEERPDVEGMTIRMAMKTGDLQTVKEGLGKVARVLEREAVHGVHQLVVAGETCQLMCK